MSLVFLYYVLLCAFILICIVCVDLIREDMFDQHTDLYPDPSGLFSIWKMTLFQPLFVYCWVYDINYGHYPTKVHNIAKALCK